MLLDNLKMLKQFIRKIDDPVIIVDHLQKKLVTNLALKKSFKNIRISQTRDLEKIFPEGTVKKINSKKVKLVDFEINFNGTSHKVSVRDFKVAKSRIPYKLLFFKDLTEIKWLERIRSEFVGNLSHELKTPLSAIQLWLDTILQYNNQNKVQKKAFYSISKNISRISSLINDMKLLSDIERYEKSLSLPREWINPKELIKQCIEDLVEEALGSKVKITVKLSESSRKLYLHKGFFYCALHNLINNALQYSGVNKKIYISLKDTRKYTILSVRDFGIGIDRTHINRLFERFYRVDDDRSRKTGGTGLGLAIVKHVMNAHNGKIDVKSANGKGSCFYLYFPNIS